MSTSLKLRYDHMYGNQVRYSPFSTYHASDVWNPLRTYWTLGYNRLYPYYNWPLELWPSEHHLRKIRVRNNLYSTW